MLLWHSTYVIERMDACNSVAYGVYFENKPAICYQNNEEGNLLPQNNELKYFSIIASDLLPPRPHNLRTRESLTKISE